MFIELGRKYYCEYCKIRIAYKRSVIADHEKSQKHLQKKEKITQYENNKAQKQKQKQQQQEQELLNRTNQEGSHLTDFLTSQQTIDEKNSFQKNFIEQRLQQINQNNPYKQADAGQDQEQVQEQEQQDEEVQEPQIINANNSSNPFQNVWSLQKDKNTGKLYFFNKLSKKKQFTKPFGLKLTASERKQWEEFQEKQQNDTNEEDVNQFGPALPESSNNQQAGEIGQWQVVEEAESFYNTHAYVEKKLDEDDDQHAYHDDENQQKIDKIEEKLDNLENQQINNNLEQDSDKQKNQLDFIDELLEIRNEQDLGKSQIKIKNERLRQLEEIGLEMQREKPIFKKNTLNATSENNNDHNNNQDTGEKSKTFKKIKLNTKKGKKIAIEDSDEEKQD